MTASITCAGCSHSYVETALFCPNCGRPKLREAAGDALLGKVLGERFLVLELLGQGGSGTIYRAEHVTLRRKVAIKVLHTELSRDDLAVERFRREATTVAEIDNEHIVEIHDFGRTPDGRLYLAMELLEGEALDAVLAREATLSVEKTADILIQVGEAMMEAHAIGYVHRDLRPRNIYLANRRGKANFVKLLDFGLAKLVETDASAASTSLGMTFGDPRYMSPEQARGDRIDRRADIYQLGCVAYEMLTGAPPFSGNRVFDILTKQVTEAPAPLPTRRPGVPLWMEAAVAKMLAKDPENRFATTTRMVEALRRGLETGEVMEDEIARRRESIPPPSVSRVMQKMGLAAAIDPVDDRVAAASPAPAAKPSETNRALPPVPAAAAAPAPAPAKAAAPDSVELLRKRTGTPRVGVPVVEAPPVEDPALAPVTGIIDKPRAVAAPPAEPGVSQVWFEDGDRPDDDAPRARTRISPSVTDLSLYDEVPRPRRWGYLLAAVAVLALGGVAFALIGRDGDAPATPPPAAPLAVAPPMADAAPSTILGEPADATAPLAVTEPAAVPVKPPDAPPPRRTRATRSSASSSSSSSSSTSSSASASRPRTSSSSDLTGFVPAGGETTFRRPGGDPAPAETPTPPRPDAAPRPTGVSGVDGPLDPYGSGEPAPAADPAAADDGSPAKKAEFYANLGSQQLASGDAANAAASFTKALELDARNVPATIGLGEIALRQGLFGDAIAHLRKAARVAPRSTRVLTLLGEAYLNSGNHADAATQFKKALQLDPDNARAREGYNEAQSRVPPPTDEE